MTAKGNKGYGKAIADAVLAAVDDPSFVPTKTRGWWDDWFAPGPNRDRQRRWLQLWLSAAVDRVPTADAALYLTEMARDVERVGSDAAVAALIDKLLPKILSNDGPDG